MIEGYVSSNFDPIVEIGLIQNGDIERISVVVDTGFNGALCLSVGRLGDAIFRHLFDQHTELSDGTVIEEPIFEGRILFDGEEHTVRITLTDSMDSMIGAKLLRDRTLYIDYPAKSVRIS